MITPSSDVYLLKVPLEINDLNQLTFTNKNTQYSYFSSLPKIPFDNFTYQRKDGIIRVPALYDDIISYNYVMYRNDNYSDKWFYAFIDKMEYVNDNVTAVSISLDTWQTWQFDLTFKPVLIDREHVNDDTVGKNIIEESLELGEMVTNGTVTNFGGVGGISNNDYCCVVEVSQVENTGTNATLTYSWNDSGSHDPSPRLNSCYRGTIPLVLGLVQGAIETPNAITSVYDWAGLSGSVINVYMLPKTLVPEYYGITITATRTLTTGTQSVSFSGAVVPKASSGVYDLGSTTFTRPTKIGTYTPKNNKVLTYPYCYFNISNNCGTSFPYHYEDFGTEVKFTTEGTFGITGNVKTTPIDYKGISSSENAIDYSVTAPKYPICSWVSDSYTNWMTQNAVNMRMQWITGGISAITSTVAGGIQGGSIGAVGGAIQGAGGLIGIAREQYMAKTQANLVPDQVHGNENASDFLWAKYRSPFTYLPMSVKEEVASSIDDYFSQFGYKINRVKVPNITGRRNWNYVKTIGCYIEADIPQDDLAQIKSMFDRGITLWHNPATFADYSQNNDII